MKIILQGSCGYTGLKNCKFPVAVEVNYLEFGAAYITHEAMLTIPGFVWLARDVYVEGEDYLFLNYEFTILKEERTLEECFGANVSPEVKAINHKAADLSMKDMTEVMTKEDRKALLLQLVKEYGVAINDGCYESECGSLQAMVACHEEEKRLLAEIIKMVEEGV